jgi:hypothetical protein
MLRCDCWYVVCVMVMLLFVCGVLAGMALAALVWIGASTAVLIVGLGLVLLLCGLLSSALAFLITAPDGSSDEPVFRTGRAR